MSEPSAALTDEYVLTAEAGDRQYFRDVWKFRELLWFLSWRDLAIRYKQTAIGVLWTVLRPLLTVAAFVFVFNKVAGLRAQGNVPYPLLVFVALVPWTLISTGMSESSLSVVHNAHIVSKVYFPRILVPASAILVAVVDSLVNLGVLAGMLAVFGYLPDWRICAFPLFFALAGFAAVGPGVLLAALNVRYRDVRFIVPFLVQFGLYVTPIGFSLSQVPLEWRTWYCVLNPLVPIIEGCRWSLLRGQGQIIPWALGWSVLVIGGLAVLSVVHFRSIEKSIADEI